MTKFVENNLLYDTDSDDLIWSSGRRPYCDDWGYLNDELIEFYKTKNGRFYRVRYGLPANSALKWVASFGSDPHEPWIRTYNSPSVAAKAIAKESGMDVLSIYKMLQIKVEAA